MSCELFCVFHCSLHCIAITVVRHNVFHTANAADVTAILETKKPHYVYTSPLYNISTVPAANLPGGVIGEVAFNAANIAQSNNLLSNLSHGVSGIAHGVTHGVSGIAHGVTDIAHNVGQGIVHNVGTHRTRSGTCSPPQEGSMERSGPRAGPRGSIDGTPPTGGGKARQSPHNSFRKSGARLLPSLAPVVKQIEQGLTVQIPSCHGNCYISFELMDDHE